MCAPPRASTGRPAPPRTNAPPTSAGLTSCVEHGAGYLSNADRFHSDTSGEEYLARQEAIRRTKETIAFRKNQVSNALFLLIILLVLSIVLIRLNNGKISDGTIKTARFIKKKNIGLR